MTLEEFPPAEQVAEDIDGVGRRWMRSWCESDGRTDRDLLKFVPMWKTN